MYKVYCLCCHSYPNYKGRQDGHSANFSILSNRSVLIRLTCSMGIISCLISHTVGYVADKTLMCTV